MTLRMKEKRKRNEKGKKINEHERVMMKFEFNESVKKEDEIKDGGTYTDKDDYEFTKKVEKVEWKGKEENDEEIKESNDQMRLSWKCEEAEIEGGT